MRHKEGVSHGFLVLRTLEDKAIATFIWNIGRRGRCRLSLFTTVRVLILKDVHGWEPSEFCFIDNSFSVIMAAREPHFLC